MPQSIPWILALLTTAVAAPTALLLFQRSQRRQPPPPLPQEWALGPRPVFNADERRVYRQLREALPHHVVLSKLPLVRFSHPNDPQQVRYWYKLLGGLHVTFAVCSANGRVLAAIDLDSERGPSRRVLQIKQAVLAACRVRYMRCPAEHMPTVAELQLLVPASSSGSRGPQAAPPATAGAPHGPAPSALPVQRPPLWKDSAVFHDSFFAPDRRDNPSGFAPLTSPAPLGASSGADAATHPGAVPLPPPSPRHPLQADDIVGIVIDDPSLGSPPSRR